MSSLQWAQKPLPATNTKKKNKSPSIIDQEDQQEAEEEEPEVEIPQQKNPPVSRGGEGTEEEDADADEAEFKQARTEKNEEEEQGDEVEMKFEESSIAPVPVETEQGEEEEEEEEEKPKRKRPTKRKIPEPLEEEEVQEGGGGEEEHVAYESEMDGGPPPRKRKPSASASKRGGRAPAKRRSSGTEDGPAGEDNDNEEEEEEDEKPRSKSKPRSRAKPKSKAKARTKAKAKPRSKSKAKPKSKSKSQKPEGEDSEAGGEDDESNPQEEKAEEEEESAHSKRSRRPASAAQHKKPRTMPTEEDRSGLDKVEIPPLSDEDVHRQILFLQHLQDARQRASGLAGGCFMGMKALLTEAQKAHAERAMNGADRELAERFLGAHFVDTTPEQILNPWDPLSIRNVSNLVRSSPGMCTLEALYQTCALMDGFNLLNEQPEDRRVVPALMERIYVALKGKKSRVVAEGQVAGSMCTAVTSNVRSKVASVHPDPKKGWVPTTTADYCLHGYRVVHYESCAQNIRNVATHALLCWLEANFADKPIMRWIRLDDARSQQLIHNPIKTFRAQFKAFLGEEDRPFPWYKKVPLKSTTKEEADDVKPMEHAHHILSDTLRACASDVKGYTHLWDRFASWCMKTTEERPIASELGGFGSACVSNGKTTKGTPVLDRLLWLNGVGNPYHMASMSQFYHDLSRMQRATYEKALSIQAQKEDESSTSAMSSIWQDLNLPTPQPIASLGRKVSSPTSAASSSSSSSSSSNGSVMGNGIPSSSVEDLLPEPVYGTPQGFLVRPGSCPKDDIIKTPKHVEATKYMTRMDIVSLFHFLSRVKKVTPTEETVIREALFGVALSALTLKIDHVPGTVRPSPEKPAEELAGGLEVMACPPWWWIFFAAVTRLFPDVVRQSDPKDPNKVNRSPRKLPSKAKTLHEAMEHTGPLIWLFSKTNEDAFLDTVSSVAHSVLRELYHREAKLSEEEWEKLLGYGRKAGYEHPQDVDPALLAKTIIKCKNLLTKFPWLWPPAALVMVKPIAPALLPADNITWSGLTPYRWRKNNSTKGLTMFLANTLRRGQPSLSADSEWPFFAFFDPNVRKEQLAQGCIDTPSEGDSQMVSFFPSQTDQQPTIVPRLDHVVIEDLILKSMHGPHGKEIFPSQVPEIMQRNGFCELPSSAYTSITEPEEPTLLPFSYAPLGVHPVDGKRVPWSNARNQILHGKSAPMKEIPYMRGQQAESLIEILVGKPVSGTTSGSSKRKRSAAASTSKEDVPVTEKKSIPDGSKPKAEEVNPKVDAVTLTKEFEGVSPGKHVQDVARTSKKTSVQESHPKTTSTKKRSSAEEQKKTKLIKSVIPVQSERKKTSIHETKDGEGDEEKEPTLPVAAKKSVPLPEVRDDPAPASALAKTGKKIVLASSPEAQDEPVATPAPAKKQKKILPASSSPSEAQAEPAPTPAPAAKTGKKSLLASSPPEAQAEPAPTPVSVKTGKKILPVPSPESQDQLIPAPVTARTDKKSAVPGAQDKSTPAPAVTRQGKKSAPLPSEEQVELAPAPVLTRAGKRSAIARPEKQDEPAPSRPGKEEPVHAPVQPTKKSTSEIKEDSRSGKKIQPSESEHEPAARIVVPRPGKKSSVEVSSLDPNDPPTQTTKNNQTASPLKPPPSAVVAPPPPLTLHEPSSPVLNGSAAKPNGVAVASPPAADSSPENQELDGELRLDDSEQAEILAKMNDFI